MSVQIIRLYFLFIRLFFIRLRFPFSKFLVNFMCFFIYSLALVPISFFFSKRNIKNKISFQEINKMYTKNSFLK